MFRNCNCARHCAYIRAVRPHEQEIRTQKSGIICITICMQFEKCKTNTGIDITVRIGKCELMMYPLLVHIGFGKKLDVGPAARCAFFSWMTDARIILHSSCAQWAHCLFRRGRKKVVIRTRQSPWISSIPALLQAVLRWPSPEAINRCQLLWLQRQVSYCR